MIGFSCLSRGNHSFRKLTNTSRMITSFSAIVVVKASKVALFRQGNPLIFTNAVDRVTGHPRDGDYVDIQDQNGRSFARGVFNSHSLYQVRVLALIGEKEFCFPIDEVLRSRVTNAVKLRQDLRLPSLSNSAFRLINGEGDRLSGLVVDVFGDVVVIQSSAFWVECHRSVLENALRSALGSVTLVWRRVENRLKLEGFVGPTEQETTYKLSKDVLENGASFTVFPTEGQKTGFYCDHRDHRAFVREISGGKTVLDLYSFSGGFGINAALGGAKSITVVDSSEYAISLARHNSRLNGVEDQIKFVEGDAVNVMKRMKSCKESFDIVVCDPPKLAPSKKNLSSALKKYTQINELAISLVSPGGTLITCSCSAAMSQEKDYLLDVIRSVSVTANRQVRVLKHGTAGVDHPVDIAYMDGKYLSVYVLSVH